MVLYFTQYAPTKRHSLHLVRELGCKLYMLVHIYKRVYNPYELIVPKNPEILDTRTIAHIPGDIVVAVAFSSESLGQTEHHSVAVII